jgi:hypothetical protein
VEVVFVAQLLVELTLALHREHVARDRQRDILLSHTWELEFQDELVVRVVHVDDRHPESAARSGRGGCRTAEEVVEESVHLALDIAEGISLHESAKWTPTLDRHGMTSLLFDVASLPAGPG